MTDPDPHAVDPVDEGRHLPTDEPLWNESHYLDFVTHDGRRGRVRPDRPLPEPRSDVVDDHGGRPRTGPWSPRWPTTSRCPTRRPRAPRRRTTRSTPTSRRRWTGCGCTARRRPVVHADADRRLPGRARESHLASASISPGRPTVSRTSTTSPPATRSPAWWAAPSPWATTMPVEGHGQRDHSWGVRDWWAFGWCWFAGRLDDGTRIHGADIRLPGHAYRPSDTCNIPLARWSRSPPSTSPRSSGAEGIPLGGPGRDRTRTGSTSPSSRWPTARWC